MSELFKNYNNLIWRIENINPAYSRAGLKTKFFSIDDDENPTQIGYDRAFQVEIIGGDSPGEVSDHTQRQTNFSFGVEVYYNHSPNRSYLYEMFSDDQRDLVWAIEDNTKWVGYDATHTSDDIGLLNRVVDKLTINRVDDIWVIRLDVATIIQETYIF